MSEIIDRLMKDFHGELENLEHKLSQARQCSQNIAKAMECIQQAERNINTLENALVAEATRPDGPINGKNEETRKAQRIVFLDDQRKLGKFGEMVADLANVKELHAKSQMIFDETKDEIEISRLQLQHYNAVLRALGG